MLLENHVSGGLPVLAVLGIRNHNWLIFIWFIFILGHCKKNQCMSQTWICWPVSHFSEHQRLSFPLYLPLFNSLIEHILWKQFSLGLIVNIILIWFYPPLSTDTQRELILKNSKLLGLGRQIGLKFFEAFVGIFSQTISTILALWVLCLWGKCIWCLKTLVITPKTCKSQMLLK